jgi:class 3 adenylate cyclase
VALVNGNIVSALIMLNRHDEASILLDAQDLQGIVDPRTLVQHFENRALMSEHAGDHETAREHLLHALAIATDAGIRAKASEYHMRLRDLALKQNNLAAYVEHNNEYTRIREEINGKETAARIAVQAKQREIDEVQREHQKHMAVLHSALPRHIADRIARGETINDHHENATVIFLDMVGFTSLSDRIPSGHVVHLLEQIFTTLDAVSERHDVVKIKTIGDSYMAVSFDSVTNAATCALDMISSLESLKITMPPSLGDASSTDDVGDIKVRIGMHCGPVTAGVIGTARMQYDVWGDTVNVASRMESSGEPGRIHVSEAFASALDPDLRRGDEDGPPPSPHLPIPLSLMSRGTLDIKGKGPMTTFWLESRL